jgi:esterase
MSSDVPSPGRMRLHYRSYGTGSSLVILHGLFGSLNNWQTLAKRLAEHFSVFALDLRNHGHSPHSGDFTYAAMAGDVREFVLEHGLSPACVIGHSMGGKTAMELALHVPDIVDRLVVVDIAPKEYPAAHGELMDAMDAVDLEAYTSREEIDHALAKRLRDTAVRQFLLTNLRRDESGRYRWRLNLDAIRANAGELGKAQRADIPFPRPVLFISGGRSTSIAPRDRPLIERLFPRATFETIDGASHWVHADAPEEFLRLVLGFLTKQLPSG